jgi:hypothetical protein
MPSVRVKRKGVTLREEGRLISYGVGDELKVTDRQYEKNKDKFELLGGRPAKLKDKEPPAPPVEDEFDVETADIEVVKAKAAELNIELGPRWGERRIRDAVTEALEEE